MIKYLTGTPITLVFAAFVGVMLPAAIPRIGGSALDFYDYVFPVVEMEGELAEILADSFVVHIQGEKLRGLECKYVSLQAFNIGTDGVRYDAFIERIDRQEDGRTKPAGTYDIGYWRIYPRKQGATSVQVYITHLCGDRRVLTKIADVKLPAL
jgi:hypothetical protein